MNMREYKTHWQITVVNSGYVMTRVVNDYVQVRPMTIFDWLEFPSFFAKRYLQSRFERLVEAWYCKMIWQKDDWHSWLINLWHGR